MSKRFCKCGALVEGDTICETCRPKLTPQHSPEYVNHYRNGWDAFSRAERERRPLCEVCSEQGRTTPTTELHHIKPIDQFPELKFEQTNLVAVCHECHEDIHGRKLPHHGKHRFRGGRWRPLRVVKQT